MESLPYIHGTTNLGKALQHLIDNVLNVGNRPDVPDILVIITDGQSTDDPTVPAKLLHSMVSVITYTPYLDNRIVQNTSLVTWITFK
jgi:hypothetical protein